MFDKRRIQSKDCLYNLLTVESYKIITEMQTHKFPNILESQSVNAYETLSCNGNNNTRFNGVSIV